mgnify:CR=1 FL=1|jgi:hypothetical protein
MPNKINFQNLVNSPDFKTKSANIVEGTLKFSFRWIAVGLKSVYDFFVTMIKMGVGK